VTWRSNDGVTKAQIDHFLVRRRWRSSCLDARVCRGADTGSINDSDHFLLICKFSQRLSTNKKKIKTNRFDVSKLLSSQIKADFELQLNNRFEALTDYTDIEDRWSKLKVVTQEVAKQVLGHTKRKQRLRISDKTIELVEKRRLLLNGTIEPLKNARKLLKQSARCDREQYWSQMASDMQQAAESHGLS
jgi:hypothetical protein